MNLGPLNTDDLVKKFSKQLEEKTKSGEVKWVAFGGHKFRAKVLHYDLSLGHNGTNPYLHITSEKENDLFWGHLFVVNQSFEKLVQDKAVDSSYFLNESLLSMINAISE